LLLGFFYTKKRRIFFFIELLPFLFKYKYAHHLLVRIYAGATIRTSAHKLQSILCIAVKLLPTFLPEVCQLSFKEIPASEQEKHVLEYHKIFYSQSHQQPLRSWFGRTIGQ
jgi:hypothetical protein